MIKENTRNLFLFQELLKLQQLAEVAVVGTALTL